MDQEDAVLDKILDDYIDGYKSYEDSCLELELYSMSFPHINFELNIFKTPNGDRHAFITANGK